MDNLRYISLQYIKGDNYEKIQCFKYEEIMELLAYIKLSGDYSQEILDNLKKMKEKDKCPVGESFLNDLVSYYNFKDIRDAIEEIDENAKGDLVIQNKKKEQRELNKIIKSNNYDSGSIIKLLDNVKTGTEAKVESKLINLGSKLERALSAVNDAKKNLENLEDLEENLVIETLIAASSASEKRNWNPTKKEYYFDEKKLKEATSKVEKISTLKSILEQAETNFDTAVIESIRDIATDINSITKKTEKELTKLEDKELTDAIKKSTTVYNNMKIIEDMITKGIDSKKFEEHAKLFEEEKGVKERVKKEKKKKKEKEVKEKTEEEVLIDNILDTRGDLQNNIMNMLHTNTDTNTNTNKKLVLIWQGILEYDDEREKVMALLKIYRKICDRNISKFGNLFTKTDISSIDDAFMIKSYAVFLDKFEKIKKSLEGKDLTKLQRGLSISLEKLFDLYGINDPDALLQSPNDEDTKYLYEHIIQ
jgi:hypothetical protein